MDPQRGPLSPEEKAHLRELEEVALYRRIQTRNALREALARRLQDSHSMLEQTTAACPGLFLEKVGLAPTPDRPLRTYNEITNSYNTIRSLMFDAMVENPHGRALMLLALGKVPENFAVLSCHHEVPQAMQAEDGRPVQDPTNLLCIVQSESKKRIHSTLHQVILDPQMPFPTQAEAAPAPVSAAIVKSVFPFYPQIRRSYESTEQIMAHLEEMEPGLREKMAEHEAMWNLPDFESSWGKQLVTLSRIANQPLPDCPNHLPFATLLKGDFASIQAERLLPLREGHVWRQAEFEETRTLLRYPERAGVPKARFDFLAKAPLPDPHRLAALRQSARPSYACGGDAARIAAARDAGNAVFQN